MSIPKDLRALLKLPALFVVLAGIRLAALGWLGWRLLEQDRALESQRLRERLENSATLLSHELDRSLATWEDLLSACLSAPAHRETRALARHAAFVTVARAALSRARTLGRARRAARARVRFA